MPESRSRRRQPFVLPRSTQYAIVAALAVVAVLCVGYVLHSGGKSAAATGGTGGTVVTSTVAGPKSVLVIGDSYAAGTGASKAEDTAWASLLAKQMGWILTNDARGGTGYATALTGARAEEGCGLNACPNFDQMLQTASRTIVPEIVLIAGGRNDTPVAPATEAAVVRKVFTDVHRLFPKARIIAVSPVWDDDPAPAALTAIQRDVSSAAKRQSGVYLNIGEPLRGHRNFIISDGVHPNDKGHAALERAIYVALQRAKLVTS